MRRVEHRIWAEQDEKVSRLLMQVGDDPPIALLEYDRSLPKKVGTVKMMELRDAITTPLLEVEIAEK